MYQLRIIVFLFTIVITFSNSISKINAAPTITGITDNRNSYINSQIPKYEKFEITFNIPDSQATNTFFPFDSNPPTGLPSSTGITVNAIFTDPTGTSFIQPAFYYQNFEDQVKNNKEWFYPTATYNWKVRFAPNITGTWKYKLTVQDATGTTQTPDTNFSVSDSNNKGFIKVSPRDSRYFEFSDGTYFPALGFNFDLNNVNPVLGNESRFQIMSANGIQLNRVWLTMFSIFGESYGKWGSSNRAHLTQEPRYGIVNPLNSILVNTFSTYYPGQNPPTLPGSTEYYMWLEFNKTVAPDGSLQRHTPCRYFPSIPLKQNTNYRVKVHFQSIGLEGPLDSTKPFGFAIKRSANELHTPIDACNNPNTPGVTTIAASYNPSQIQNDSENPGWKYLEGTYNSGSNDFLGHLYITFDNVNSTNSDLIAGQAFIDKVWFEESSCTSNCPNLIFKPNMDMHYYINQRDAHGLDKVVNLAKQYGIYFKAVMLEKNDRILQTIGSNGQPVADQSTDNFYGSGTVLNKVRWLQQAWWRYMQARWGYSTNIHSWELMNEGAPSNNHFIQADEFGKFMHCRVFGKETVVDTVLGNKCLFNHPNSHLVTTSFSNSSYPWQFWNNGGSSAGYKLYRDIDYADQHYYSNVDDTSVLASYYDSALFSYNLSMANSFSSNTRKPLIRGESGWSLPASTYFENNSEGGEWLHDYIWGGINSGGLMEHFFIGGTYTKQLYNLGGNPPHDHRPMFKTYYNFIKDVPLSNGNYQDASASASVTNIRAWGQKDLINKRAHLWIANKNHTWYNSMGGYPGGPAPTPVGSVNGNVILSGFTPNTNYPIEWWNTYTGLPDTTVGNPDNIITSDSVGNVTLNVTDLVTDSAVRIGNYTNTQTPSPLTGDINGDGAVNILDYSLLRDAYGSNNVSADLNRDGIVNILDFTVLSINFGRS